MLAGLLVLILVQKPPSGAQGSRHIHRCISTTQSHIQSHTVVGQSHAVQLHILCPMHLSRPACARHGTSACEYALSCIVFAMCDLLSPQLFMLLQPSTLATQTTPRDPAQRCHAAPHTSHSSTEQQRNQPDNQSSVRSIMLPSTAAAAARCAACHCCTCCLMWFQLPMNASALTGTAAAAAAAAGGW